MPYLCRTHVEKKYLLRALASVHGIGQTLASEICERLGYHKNFRIKNLSEKQTYYLNQIVDELAVAYKGDLELLKKDSVSHLIQIKSYRGFRHRRALPVRGQRTHTNSKTQKKLKFVRKIKR